ATIGDFNRDGLQDVAIAYPGADGRTNVDVIRRWRNRMERQTLWSSRGLPISRIKLATADVNLDGMADLIVYKGLGAGGTAIMVELGDYEGVLNFSSIQDADLAWSTARPY